MRHILSFRPLERLAIDFVKLDPGRSKVEDVLVMTDSFTKFAIAVPCRDQTAATVARALRDHWFVHYGVPAQIHSDQGRNFESRHVYELCQLYGITKTRTTSYHPQGNGQTERFNRTLYGLIKSIDGRRRNQWPELLPHLVFMYNSTPHSVTGYTPYSLMFGREPMVPLDHLLNRTHYSWEEDTVAQQAKFLQSAYKVASERLKRAAEANKRQYDRKARATPLAVGDRVLLKQHAFKQRHKLANHFKEEPYVIVKRNLEQDLFAIRPALGGQQKWVNRSSLVLDPRCRLPTLPDEPMVKFPLPCDDTSETSSEESSSDLDGDIVLNLPAVGQAQSGSVANEGPTEVGPESQSTGESLRRSERLKQKRLGAWPNAIT